MRKFLVNVNGNTYEVEIEESNSGALTDRSSPPISAAGQATAPAAHTVAAPVQETPKKEIVVSADQEVIEAPMPGNIWKIVTSEGATVKAGDVLLILEAMKMENDILAPRDGKVVSITTSEGSNVNTGDKLVVIE